MLTDLIGKNKNKINVAVLDIGSSKIVSMIASLNNDFTPKVVAIGHNACKGFKAGVITDIKELEKSILTSIDSAEKMAGFPIEKVVLVLSGTNLRSHIINEKVTISDKEVTKRDVGSALKKALSSIDTSKYKIIHYFPLEFSIDGLEGISNPIGLVGKELGIKINIITLSQNSLINIVNCLANCQINVEDLIVSPFSDSFSCITDEEKDLGVTIINMGSSTTSYAVFADGYLLSMGYIPLGGFNISSDISKVLSTNFHNAERLKILQGSAISIASDNNKTLDVPVVGEGSADNKEINTISLSLLNDIINARSEEILNILKKKLLLLNLPESCTKRIVLTGGACQLNSIKELTAKLLNAKVRTSKPLVPEGLTKDNRILVFSSSIGALNYYISKKHEEAKSEENITKKESWFNGLKTWFQDNW